MFFQWMLKQHTKFIIKYLNISGTIKKTEPIARKTIHRKQKFEGLNLIEPEAHNYAMRINDLLTLKQKKTTSWKNLATYRLTIDIHNYTKEYIF